jgi:hypothetical protein
VLKQRCDILKLPDQSGEAVKWSCQVPGLRPFIPKIAANININSTKRELFNINFPGCWRFIPGNKKNQTAGSLVWLENLAQPGTG